MKGALIKRIIENDIEKFQVQMIIDISSKTALDDFKRNLIFDYAVVVNNDVQAYKHYYDPDTNIFTDEHGVQVYPPLSYDEIINNLSKNVAELRYEVNINDLSLDEVKEYIIKKNKNNLEKYLYDNPMVYNNKHYTVTSDKQNQLTGVLQAYSYAQSIGKEIPLTWNETGEECVPYTFEELVTLYLKMLEYVKPIVTYQQHNEILIKNAESVDEILQVDIDFSKYEPVDVNTPEE